MVQQAVLAFEPQVTETVRLEGRELPPKSNESQEKTSQHAAKEFFWSFT